jgi:hypothetical protein
MDGGRGGGLARSVIAASRAASPKRGGFIINTSVAPVRRGKLYGSPGVRLNVTLDMAKESISFVSVNAVAPGDQHAVRERY